MSTRLDPTDQSKLFGQTLLGVIDSVQELESSDCEDQLAQYAYSESMTERQQDRLRAWINDKLVLRDSELKKLLYKCPHLYAMATLLRIMIREEEK